MASGLTAAKQQLRNLVKQKLSAVTSDSVSAQSRKIFERLQDFQPYVDAQRISIYLSMPSGEVQTDAIVRHALSSGKQVYVPFLHKSALEQPDSPTRVMDMVRLRDLQDYEGLKPDRWGIPSLDPSTIHCRQRILGDTDSDSSDVAGLDLMLLPGVAFDLDDLGVVRRLGHGKGFYDFFMNRYFTKFATLDSTVRPILFVGLALREQLLSGAHGEEIPMGPFDRRLHGLVLGDGRMTESPQDFKTSPGEPGGRDARNDS